MQKIKNTFFWILAGFLALLSLPFIPSLGSGLLILSALLVAPIKPIQNIVENITNKVFVKPKNPKSMKGLLIALIAIFGIIFAGASTETTDVPDNHNSSYVEEQQGSTDTEGSSDIGENSASNESKNAGNSTDIPSSSEDETDTTAPDSSETNTSDESTDPSPDSSQENDTSGESDTPNPNNSKEDEDTEHTDDKNDDTDEPSDPPVNSTFSIHFIDVGQADAALVECDGHYMLIDGGNKADSNVIYSVLKKAGVSKLDIVVGTHAHEDHIGGLPGAFNYTTADITLCPVRSYDSKAFDDFKKYAEEKGGGITIPSVGDTYTLGSATITILGVNGGSDTNDTSIILMIQYGKTSFLFTGDAEREAEQAVINSGVDLSATVLKVGHHGSDTSTSYLFLRNIAPKYAVISVGDGNSYGHPTEDTLSRLRDADVTVFRTDLQGDIYCTSDGSTVSFTVTRNADADTLAPQTPQGTADPTPDPTPPQNPSDDNDSGEGDAKVADYVGNKNSHIFHYADCSSVKQMSEKNKYYFTGTREEMIDQGYTPCQRCNP